MRLFLMEYPKEVIAESKGKKEARVLVERGKYVKYTYVDANTGKLVKEGKESIFLKSEEGKIEHLFIIPLQKRFLLIKEKETEESVKKRKIFDKNKKKAVPLFEE